MKIGSKQLWMVRAGKKTIELCLFDDKCRQIHIGDIIELVDIEDNKDTLCVKVIGLFPFDSFETLYKHLPLLDCGYTEENLSNASPSDMNKYYSKSDQEKYGVIGIRIALLSDKPLTTLFMLSSLDGKISTGASPNEDFDKDLPHIKGVAEGLYQYYALEKTTDLWSFCTGATQAKVGVNSRPVPAEHSSVSFCIVDNHHLQASGIEYFCGLSKQFVLITTNPQHPAFKCNADNLHIIYQDVLDLQAAFHSLKSNYGCEYLTVQSGGTMNSLLFQAHLIDKISIIMAPLVVGGSLTPTLIDGTAFPTPLKLTSVQQLQDSYLHLQYDVIY